MDDYQDFIKPLNYIEFEVSFPDESNDYVQITLYDYRDLSKPYCGKILYSQRLTEYCYSLFDDVLSEDEFYDMFKDKEIIYLETLIVESSKRNKGYGNMLMNKFIELTKNFDICLNASAEKESLSALSQKMLVLFYKKFGFKEIHKYPENSTMIKFKLV